MADLDPVNINMCSIKVAGVGGLGMFAVIAVMAYALPEVRWLVFLGLGGGTIAGVLSIGYRSLRGAPPSPGPILMVNRSPERAAERTKDHASVRLSAAPAQ